MWLKYCTLSDVLSFIESPIPDLECVKSNSNYDMPELSSSAERVLSHSVAVAGELFTTCFLFFLLCMLTSCSDLPIEAAPLLGWSEWSVRVDTWSAGYNHRFQVIGEYIN